MVEQLKQQADHIREGVIEVVYTKQQGHVGGPLSAADLLAALYFHVMDVRPSEPNWEERDRFILSKGHSGIALYVTLALKGYFSYEELFTFDQLHSRLQAHPDMTKLPGIDMSTGSLGQGISAGVGMALAAKLKKADFRTFVMIGDGESQEGQVWEAAHVASRYRLNNLIVIVDNNGLQQYGWREESALSRERPEYNHVEKWKAFGWKAISIDGHSMKEIVSSLDSAKNNQVERPIAIIANTVKGKGVSFMEGDFNWHSKVPTDEEFERAMDELGRRETR
ncbi:transketolase [Evansella halocellulosilytica]|uniref:transketolase n=1 Tax=Evansella halocellulosilytica TaxID=2011013 RepID=UPI000BB6D065|nr:transketolase [Evansella halocellulosilytica]